jgi:DNA-binding response OmpR family regulator
MTTGKMRILVADDEKPMAHALELKLSHEGFEVQTATNGDEALALIDEFKPQLLLLDLVMPKKDGFAVLEELHERGNKIPIIITTNLGQEEDKQRVAKLGAKNYLVKSNTPIAAIVAEVKKVLGV